MKTIPQEKLSLEQCIGYTGPENKPVLHFIGAKGDYIKMQEHGEIELVGRSLPIAYENLEHGPTEDGKFEVAITNEEGTKVSLYNDGTSLKPIKEKDTSFFEHTIENCQELSPVAQEYQDLLLQNKSIKHSTPKTPEDKKELETFKARIIGACNYLHREQTLKKELQTFGQKDGFSNNESEPEQELQGFGSEAEDEKKEQDIPSSPAIPVLEAFTKPTSPEPLAPPPPKPSSTMSMPELTEKAKKMDLFL